MGVFDYFDRHRRAGLILAAVVSAVGVVDSVLNLADRFKGGIDPAEILFVARVVSGPLALVLVLFLWRRPRVVDPRQFVRPEWSALNQAGHWTGVREMAWSVDRALREAMAMDVTVQVQNDLRTRADSLDFQVSQYAEMWERGSFYDPVLRRQWEYQSRVGYSGPVWAQPLWERVEYALWWLSRHDPLRPEFTAGSA